MNERLRLGRRLNDRLNGSWVIPKKVYRGNALTKFWKWLNCSSDGARYPDSRPYLEKLGIKVLGDVHVSESERHWGARDPPEYECELPDNLRTNREDNETEGDMSTLNVYDSSGRGVVRYFVKYGREHDLSVDLRGLEK